VSPLFFPTTIFWSSLSLLLISLGCCYADALTKLQDLKEEHDLKHKAIIQGVDKGPHSWLESSASRIEFLLTFAFAPDKEDDHA